MPLALLLAFCYQHMHARNWLRCKAFILAHARNAPPLSLTHKHAVINDLLGAFAGECGRKLDSTAKQRLQMKHYGLGLV